MFWSRALLLALGVVPLILASARPGAPAKGSLAGAWKVVHVSFTGPDTSWMITNPQPSLYIFTQHYYSIMYVPGSNPRPLFNGSTPTDAEKVAAYNSLIANSGTYLITDSTLTARPIVAKNPNFMSGQSELSLAYRLRGDSLWLTLRSSPVSREQGLRTTLVRLE